MRAEYDVDKETEFQEINKAINKKKLRASFQRYLVVSTIRPNCLVAYKRRTLIGRRILKNCAYPRHLCKSASFAYRGRMCVVAIALSGQISATDLFSRRIISKRAVPILPERISIAGIL